MTRPAGLESLTEHHAIQGGHESLLEIVRRLDWRFLLPVPDLNRVCYVGKNGTALHQALKQFSKTLVFVPESKNSTDLKTKPCDLLVFSSANIDALAPASASLRTGGYLYLEHKRKRSFESIAPLFGRLQELGYVQLNVYWHRPDFEHCLDVLPAKGKAALRHFLNRNQSSLQGRLAAMLGKQLLNLNLGIIFMRNVSVVALKAENQGAHD